MSQLNQAVKALHEVDAESGKRRKESALHPFSIFLVTCLYIGIIASFSTYDLGRLVSMVIFLIVTGIWCDISLKNSFCRLKYILLLPLFLGMANLLFDRQILGYVGKLPITGGMVSMMTLFCKGVLMVYATYFMILRIGIEGLCLSLKSLHVPGILITQVTLTYRYIIVLLREMERMWIAYRMRAPGQKGIQMKAWGPFLGMLFFRSVERAGHVYESMKLRGYREEVGIPTGNITFSWGKSVCYVMCWGMVFLLLRYVPVFACIGAALVR